MNCFSCMSSRKYISNFQEEDADEIPTPTSSHESKRSKRSKDSFGSGEFGSKRSSFNSTRSIGSRNQKNNLAQSFTFRQLSYATKNFKIGNLIGEGGFGKVYKGRLQTGQIVAIKQLDRNSLQGNQEFIVEVLMLSLLHHQNLVTLVGYCNDGNQKLLVYEYMAMGSLDDHLFDVDPNKEPLDWNTRIKIALGVAQGLEYLHCTANPPVIYRDFKSANILLDENFSPKLSDFGLAKLGPMGDNTHVSTRVMGTYGYCAPEYAMSGKLTLKSDIYSFGVVLLELISGRRAIDPRRKHGEISLTAWARPFLNDRSKCAHLVDPLLRGCYPLRCLNNAIQVAAMCLQDEPHFRPLITDIVLALEHLASQPYREGSHLRKLSNPLPHTQWDGVSAESDGNITYASA